MILITNARGERGKHLGYGFRVVRVGITAPGDVMGIQFSGDVDVAVRVESYNELVALVPEVPLGGEDGWFLRGGSFCPRSRFGVPQAIIVECHYIICVRRKFR